MINQCILCHQYQISEISVLGDGNLVSEELTSGSSK
jgi:hypothetical protein